MAKQNGTFLVLKVGTDVIAAAKSHKLSIKRAAEEVSTKDDGNWKNWMETDIDWEVSFEGLMEPTGTYNRDELIEKILAGGTIPAVSITPLTPVAGDIILTGPVIFDSYDESSERAKAVSFSGMFKGAGPLVKTVHPA